MKNNYRGILLFNISLILLCISLFVFLSYNAFEERIVSDSISRYLGIGTIILMLIQTVFMAVFTIKYLIRKRFFKSIISLFLTVALVLLISQLGRFFTVIYLGGGAVGGH